MKTYVKIYQMDDSGSGRSVKSRHITLQDVAPDQVVEVLRSKYSTGRPPGAGDPAGGVSTKSRKSARNLTS